uniref:Uncharacterized protein n=1 Tax=Plectus sambesii TaxID=2011161 RepID=A0A914V307_9BILA
MSESYGSKFALGTEHSVLDARVEDPPSVASVLLRSTRLGKETFSSASSAPAPSPGQRSPGQRQLVSRLVSRLVRVFADAPPKSARSDKATGRDHARAACERLAGRPTAVAPDHLNKRPWPPLGRTVSSLPRVNQPRASTHRRRTPTCRRRFVHRRTACLVSSRRPVASLLGFLTNIRRANR